MTTESVLRRMNDRLRAEIKRLRVIVKILSGQMPQQRERGQADGQTDHAEESPGGKMTGCAGRLVRRAPHRQSLKFVL